MSSPEAGSVAHGRGMFIVINAAGPQRDHSRDTREQRFWDDHARFIDPLVEEGFIVLGGPLVDEGGALLIVRAHDESEIRAKLQDDPWYREGILRLVSIKRWQIFIDEWH